MVDYTFAITGSDLSGPAWKAFVENTKRANEQLAALGKTEQMDKLAAGVTSVQSRIESLVGTAKGFVASFSAAWAVQQVYAFGEGIQAAAVEVARLSKATNLSGNEVQALQSLAAQTKRPFEELAQTYAKNQAELDKLTGRFVETGQAIDRHAIDKFAALDKKAQESAQKMEEQMNRVKAAIAPLYSEGKALVLDAAADATDRLVRAVGGLDLGKAHTIIALMAGGTAALGAIIGGGVGGQVSTENGSRLRDMAAEMERLQQNLKTAEVRDPQGKRASTLRGDISRLQEGIANERARQGAALARTYGGGDDSDLNRPVPLLPPTPPVVGGSGGGGGGPARDRIGENLVQFTAQAEAARVALLSLQKVGQNPLIPLDDLERQVKLEKDIADAIAAAKKYAADDPRIPQLEQQIRRREEAESGLAKLTNAYKLADTTERQYGDGVAARMQTEAQLRDALDTRRLSTQAYDLAIQELGKSTEDLRLKNLGLAGGLPALAAGWEAARLQADRANNMFATGGKLYEQVVGTMTLATTSWGQTFDQVLLRAGESWARFLLDMAARAAASQVFSALGNAGGILGAIFGGNTANASIMATGDAAAAAAVNTFGPVMVSAAGGPLGAGQSSIVGENGPELFLPNTGGNILNRQQLDALGVGGGDGGSVVYQTINVSVGEFVTTQQWARDVPRITEAARTGASQALIAQRRRGVRAVKAAFA